MRIKCTPIGKPKREGVEPAPLTVPDIMPATLPVEQPVEVPV